ncbi:hypothetical protein PGAG_00014 [Phaeocystis globosa virus 12T]|uniref:Hemolysin-like protein n=1 Tax=Phaeocystis globosa virus PgV-16T TaxID=3071227 RepID=A0AC59EWP1_9VIRU|nr:hemolysin-like protein [Phaeocystis globosa virus]AET72904.1 hypothetical protein PGAG_00014 [Phaeocystis globosa virus 12T]AET73722.1 hypothetical protein PGBG_00014 [Phaeocystis globosa virus 14T]AGM15366.1 hemolysin-like protein [Phaeocystis globosa virus PgV-16T]UYE94096.1 hemolysin-like protein [Phaeocystis globosa virus]
MSSITNQIVANIKKTSTNFNSYSFIDTENVVCIDTSKNRIGINQKKPEYSIDISGISTSNAVRVHNLHINNKAMIEEISCNKITMGYFNSTLSDASHMNVDSISGDYVDVNRLIVQEISTSQISVPDISVDYLDVANNINVPTMNVSAKIKTANLEVENAVNFPSVDISNLKVDTFADIEKCNIEDLSASGISAEEITCKDIYVKDGLYSIGETSFNNLHVDGDISATNMFIQNKAIINEISAHSLDFNILTGVTFNVTQVKSDGKIVINDGKIGDPNNPANAVFKTLNVTNVDVSESLICTGISDLSDGLLVLPGYKTEYDGGVYSNGGISRNIDPGTLAFDTTSNILKIYNNNSAWNNLVFKQNFVTISLRRDISGNTISYNAPAGHFVIDQSDNLRLDQTSSPTYPNIKYIPLAYDVDEGNKFGLTNNSKTVEIKNPSDGELFEIHASVGIKYLNKSPGDVEPNTYTVGIYPDMNTTLALKDSIDNSFVHMNSAVVAFDNSFNYANITLNYMGQLADTNKGHVLTERTGFNFYISSVKDINFIAIDQFNATIKQLQTS